MIVRVVFALLLFVFSFQPAFSQSGKVKNVIFFIGDGMHFEHEIAASRYLTGENTALAWHGFPYMSFVSTWDINTYNKYAFDLQQEPFSYSKFFPTIGYDPDRGGLKPYPLQKGVEKGYFLARLKSPIKDDYSALATDSAAASTAFATGIKTSSGNLSWLPGDLEKGGLKTIMELARAQKGSAIGVVTTVPFNHATPAAFVAHNISRKNYYTGKNDDFKGMGIAEEILTITRPEVVIGGGHPAYTKRLLLNNKNYMTKELFEKVVFSGEYVIAEKKDDLKAADSLLKAAQISSSRGLKLFGLYGGPRGCIKYPEPVHEYKAPFIKKEENEPSLADMVNAALTVLSRDKDGFFLMAEQGTIDWANHENDYKGMIGNMVDLNAAVASAIEFVERPDDNIDWSNTLLIVTSDHANSYMRIKGSEILCKGCLPTQIKFMGKYFYPGDEVKYGTHKHTNELVNLYVMGQNTRFFQDVENLWYPGTNIIDNTHIFDALIKAMDIKYDKGDFVEKRQYELPEFQYKN